MFSECRIEAPRSLSSGRESDVFYDFDLLRPSEVATYVEKLISKVPDDVFERVDFIATPALGGIIPSFLVSFAKNIPLVIVDKEGEVRGPSFKTGSYLIVDDVVTSFQAARRVVSFFPGMECVGVASYIFRGSSDDIVRNSDIPVFYLSKKEPERVRVEVTAVGEFCNSQ